MYSVRTDIKVVQDNDFLMLLLIIILQNRKGIVYFRCKSLFFINIYITFAFANDLLDKIKIINLLLHI